MSNHTHLMDGTWDGRTAAQIAALHPHCVACKTDTVGGLTQQQWGEVISAWKKEQGK